jgi:hypothetical protein
MSLSLALDKPQIRMGRPLGRAPTIGPISLAIRETASKSPGEAMGKPASHTSTPMFESCKAIFNFSSVVRVAPGDCSPSRRVVSKMIRRSLASNEEFENDRWKDLASVGVLANMLEGGCTGNEEFENDRWKDLASVVYEYDVGRTDGGKMKSRKGGAKGGQNPRLR